MFELYLAIYAVGVVLLMIGVPMFVKLSVFDAQMQAATAILIWPVFVLMLVIYLPFLGVFKLAEYIRSRNDDHVL